MSRILNTDYMLTLSSHQQGAAPLPPLKLTELRVWGGTLWNPLDRSLIATYSHGTWKHGERRYPILAVSGGGCLVFGITRDPTIVSRPIGDYYLIGSNLNANGVPIARYHEQQDVWQGIARPIWWHAMRILGVEAVTPAVDEPRRELLNPWRPNSMHNVPHCEPEDSTSHASQPAHRGASALEVAASILPASSHL